MMGRWLLVVGALGLSACSMGLTQREAAPVAGEVIGRMAITHLEEEAGFNVARRERMVDEPVYGDELLAAAEPGAGGLYRYTIRLSDGRYARAYDEDGGFSRGDCVTLLGAGRPDQLRLAYSNGCR